MFEDFWRPAKLPYIKWNALYKLLSNYYELELTDNPDFLLYSSFGHKHLKYNCMRIFFTGENVRPNFKECDYAFSFDFPITERNYRLPLYRLNPSYQTILSPRSSEKILNENRKFCCFLASNPQGTERNRFFELLSAYKQVDSGGKHLLNIGEPVPRGEEINWMSQYKFCIAFENSSYPGYTTEKLTNALAAGSIPIYWGNPVVDRDFDTKAFIDCHEFNIFEDVVDHVIKVDQDPQLQQAILDEPILPGGKETSFCIEENIISKFDEIFLSKKTYITTAKKRIQRLRYPLLTGRRLFEKKIKPRIKSLISQL